MPCSLGKVCNKDTVDDSVQSQSKKKERRIHRLLLRQIQLNSDAIGKPQILYKTSTLKPYFFSTDDRARPG